MNRRDLLKGLAGIGAGIILPPTLAENAEAARRYWALDQTMIGGRVYRIRAGEWVTVEIGSRLPPGYRPVVQEYSGFPDCWKLMYTDTAQFAMYVTRADGTRVSLV